MDVTGNYVVTYTFMGTSMVAGAAVVGLVPLVNLLRFQSSTNPKQSYTLTNNPA